MCLVVGRCMFVLIDGVLLIVDVFECFGGLFMFEVDYVVIVCGGNEWFVVVVIKLIG